MTDSLHTINQSCFSISSGGKEICRASSRFTPGIRGDGRWSLFIPNEKNGRGPDITGILYEKEAIIEIAKKFRASWDRQTSILEG